MLLKRVDYRVNFNTIDLVYDPTNCEEEYSHTYFEVGDLRIYVDDSEFNNLLDQCKKEKIPVYYYTQEE
jgi:hypothetical protein